MRGSVRQRGKTWTAYWSMTDPATGERRQHTKGSFDTKRVAQAHLNSILEKVEQGAWRPDAKLKVVQLVREQLAPGRRIKGTPPGHYRPVPQHRRGVGPPSRRRPRCASAHACPCQRACDGSALKRLPAWSRRSVRPVSASGCQRVESLVVLGREGRTAQPGPPQWLPATAGASRPMTSWSTEEARGFLSATKHDRLAFRVGVAATRRGLRRGELCGLRWQDVDLAAGVARVTRTRVIVDGRPTESLPKTAAGRRSIPLDTSWSTFSRHTAPARQSRGWRLEAPMKTTAGLWPTSSGRPLYPDTISERFAKLVKSAELRPIRAHDMRHTAASLMFADGVPVKVVHADLLGHRPEGLRWQPTPT